MRHFLTWCKIGWPWLWEKQAFKKVRLWFFWTNVITMIVRNANMLKCKYYFKNMHHFKFLNASKHCGSVLKNDFVVVGVADELLSYFQRLFRKSCQNLSITDICCWRCIKTYYEKGILQSYQKINGTFRKIFFSNLVRNKTESKFSPRPRVKKLFKFCKTTPILSCFHQSYSIFNWIENYNMH